VIENEVTLQNFGAGHSFGIPHCFLVRGIGVGQLFALLVECDRVVVEIEEEVRHPRTKRGKLRTVANSIEV
jgi:hypothetical protein